MSAAHVACIRFVFWLAGSEKNGQAGSIQLLASSTAPAKPDCLIVKQGKAGLPVITETAVAGKPAAVHTEATSGHTNHAASVSASVSGKVRFNSTTTVFALEYTMNFRMLPSLTIDGFRGTI